MVQCPELSSPTSEAQARHQARAPRPCHPLSSEEKGEKKERKIFKKILIIIKEESNQTNKQIHQYNKL